MSIQLKSKHYYARGSRHAGECYGAVVGASGAPLALAYLVVDGAREHLELQWSRESPPVPITSDTFVLSPCFAGEHLLWVERRGSEWPIRCLDLSTPSAEHVSEPIAVRGRPQALSSTVHNRQALLVWEERLGKQTRIRLARLNGGGAAPAVIDVTGGAHNAYDPVCAVADDGTVYVAYCAFIHGHYRILAQALDPSGSELGPPVQLSNESHACVYPSLHCRKAGGVWFSYTCLNRNELFRPQVLHYRAAAQRQFTLLEAGTAYVGILEDRAVHGILPSLEVPDSTGSGHTRVLEDGGGNPFLLLRLHSEDTGTDYPIQDEPLRHRTRFDPLTTASATRAPGGPNNHPSVSLTAFGSGSWSTPRCLIPRAHVEAPISVEIESRSLCLAFTEDSRHTGWNLWGEWFDGEGQLGVGLARVDLLSSDRASYSLHPQVAAPRPGPSIEDPPIDRLDDRGYMHAIGQTHAHSNLSVCVREAEREPNLNYRLMQDAQHSDFGAVTDHAYNMWHTEMLLMNKYADYYYFPGEFVAVPAYEWTGDVRSYVYDREGAPWGHVNPLYLEESGDLAVYTPWDPDCPGGTLPHLWQAYAGRQIVTIPHHVADKAFAYNWDVLDPTFVPVIEIYQTPRGSGEKPGAPGVFNRAHRDTGWAVDALGRGIRFGFIASADHLGMARAGVLVTELTRTGLYQGLRARRCFGTTGIAVRLAFTCNGEMMGTEVAAKRAEFRVQAAAPELIHEVQIVHNGEDTEHILVGAESVDYVWQAERQAPGEFWYCRLILDNGEIVWSSPIWLV